MKNSARLSSASNAAAYILPLIQARKLWRAAEQHTGKLNRSDRRALVEIVRSYVSAAQFEENAEPIDAAKRRVTRLRGAAESFWQIVLESPPAGSDALHAAEYTINRNLRIYTAHVVRHKSEIAGALPVPASVSLFIDLMGELVTACRLAEREFAEMEGDEYFKPGAAWNNLVGRLASFYLDSTGRQPTARKDEGYEFSPFVHFVHAVQSTLPPGFWLHPKVTRPNSVTVPTTTLNRAIAKALGLWRSGLKDDGGPAE
jgi:hypothetical protein